MFADGDVQFSVAAKMQSAALMAAGDFAAQCSLIVADEQNLLAAGGGHVARCREAADAVMGIRVFCDIADIDEGRARELLGPLPSPSEAAGLPRLVKRAK